MSEENRRCKVTAMGTVAEGTFIKFAPVAAYDEANQLHTPERAIVELDNGRVVTVNPDEIRFIKN